MTPFQPAPRTITVDLTDAEADAVRHFIAYGASAGPGRIVPPHLERLMTPAVSVVGKITHAYDLRRRADGEGVEDSG